jgi:hypothetical protein
MLSSRMPDNPVALPLPFAVRLDCAEGWDPISRRMIWQSPDSEPMKTSPASRYEMHEAGETWRTDISGCRTGLLEDVQCRRRKLWRDFLPEDKSRRSTCPACHREAQTASDPLPQ